MRLFSGLLSAGATTHVSSCGVLEDCRPEHGVILFFSFLFRIFWYRIVPVPGKKNTHIKVYLVKANTLSVDCPKPQVWQLRCDVHILDHGGNLIDASTIATMAALRHFRRPGEESNSFRVLHDSGVQEALAEVDPQE